MNYFNKSAVQPSWSIYNTYFHLIGVKTKICKVRRRQWRFIWWSSEEVPSLLPEIQHWNWCEQEQWKYQEFGSKFQIIHIFGKKKQHICKKWPFCNRKFMKIQKVHSSSCLDHSNWSIWWRWSSEYFNGYFKSTKTEGKKVKGGIQHKKFRNEKVVSFKWNEKCFLLI